MSENFDSPRDFSIKKPKRKITRIASERIFKKSEIFGHDKNAEENAQNEANNDDLFKILTKNNAYVEIPVLNLKGYDELQEGFLKEFLAQKESKVEETNEISEEKVQNQNDLNEENNANNFQNKVKEENNEISEERMKILSEKLKKIAIELINTERTYVNHLTDLLRVFYEPMIANAQGPEENRKISIEDVKSLFSTVRVILSFNTILYNSLSRRVDIAEGQPVVIGDIFLSQVCFYFYFSSSLFTSYFIFYILILTFIVLFL